MKHLRFHVHPVWIACLTLLFMQPCLAQWQWVDANGRKVFSDRPPPADIPDQSVLQVPSGLPAVRKPGADAGASAPSASAQADGEQARVAQQAKKQQAELEARKKQAEDAEKAKQKAEEAQLAAVRADNCKRAQASLNALNTGTPMRTFTPQGERVFMDEQARINERNRLQQAVQQNCVR